MYVSYSLSMINTEMISATIKSPMKVSKGCRCRYEREHGKGHRSVLQKVLEQDERPSRAMILCIAEILWPEAGAAQPGQSHPSAGLPHAPRDCMSMFLLLYNSISYAPLILL